MSLKPLLKVRESSSNLTLFIFLWSVATLSHQILYSEIFISVFGFLLTVFAFLNLLRPFDLRIFFLQILSQLLAVLYILPIDNHHWYSTLFISATLVFSYSLLLFKKKSLTGENLYSIAAPALRVELLVIYLVSFIHKLNYDYFSPDVSCGVIHYKKLAAIIPLLPVNPLITNFMIYISAGFEILIPLLLIFRKTRTPGIILGVVFHILLGIIGYRRFSYVMFALLALYLPLSIFNGQTLIQSLSCGIKNKIAGFKILNFVMFFALALPLLFLFVQTFYKVVDLILNDSIKIGFLVKYLSASGFYLFCVYVLFYLLTNLINNKAEWEEGFFRTNFSLLIFPLLLFIHSLQPYLGLKTHNTLSMYSNLRTEGENPNHLFLDRSLRVFDFQDSLVEIRKSSVQKLKKLQSEDMSIPFYQLRLILYSEIQEGKKNIVVHYVKDGKEHKVNNAENSSLFNEPVPYIFQKYLNFRPIEKKGKRGCTA